MLTAPPRIVARNGPVSRSACLAIAQIGNVIIHVRYSSLSAVTRADLNRWLTKAVNAAQPQISG